MKRVASCFPVVAVCCEKSATKEKSEKQAKDKDRMHGPKAFLPS